MTIRTIEQVKSTLSKTPLNNEPFKLGQIVTFTNDYGVSFKGKKIIGFGNPPYNGGGTIYLDYDCYWFPATAESLTAE